MTPRWPAAADRIHPTRRHRRTSSATGALITANLAMEYGISEFAVPGDVDREISKGCNLLIRDAPTRSSIPPSAVGERTTVG